MADYKKCLQPEQAKDMGRFLHALLWASGKAKDAGVKPNVELFMKSWMGMPVTGEGKKHRKMQQHDDWAKKRRLIKNGTY